MMNTAEIVAAVYKNPDLCEAFAKGNPDAFRAIIGLVPVADWVNYVLVSKRNADRALKFANTAPVAWGILGGYLGLGQLPDPVPNPVPVGGARAFATDFLRGWPGGDCSLFHHSKATTEAQRVGSRAYMVQSGYTVLVSYAKDAGDGDGKHHVDVLQDLAAARNNLRANRAAGLANAMIIFSDSCGLKGKAALEAYAAETVRQLDDLVDVWILFLEPNDTADDGTVNAVGAAVRLLTKKLLLIQTHPVVSGSTINVNSLRWAKQGWCDGVCIQVTHPNSPIPASAAPAVVQKCRAAIPGGKLLLAFEYSWKADEKVLGDAFISAGVDGIGDGCNAGKVAQLPKIIGATTGGQAPASPGGAQLKLVAKYSGSQVRFEATGIEGWPKDLDKKKNRYLGGAIRIKGKIVDHFWRGATTAFVSNAWGNDEHRISVRQGEVVPVQLVSTDGKQTTNTVMFTWPFQGTV